MVATIVCILIHMVNATTTPVPSRGTSHSPQCAHADFPMSLPGTPCSNSRVHHCRKIESRMRIRIRIRIRMPPSHLSWAALPQGRAPAPAAPQRSRAGLPKTCRWNRKNPSHMKKIFALAREPIFRFVVAFSICRRLKGEASTRL